MIQANLIRYATEIDVHFVRKSVRAIGKLAIKIESAARLCIETLLELVNAKIPYIVQEATVVIRNIFRKYPNQYEGIIATVIQNIDELDEPEAKAAVIWIIGQYADRIENSDGFLQDYLATFHDEPVEVQLTLLTATVKLFILRPTKGQELVPQVLKWCTEETDDPDLRDRGYMYWRLLSTDPATAKKIVMGEKPPITAESEKLDPVTLEELCLNVGTLATVYLKPVQQVFRNARVRKLQNSPALQRRERDVLSAIQTAHMTPLQPQTTAQQTQLAQQQQNTISPSTTDAADLYFASLNQNNMSALQNMSLSSAPLAPQTTGMPVNAQQAALQQQQAALMNPYLANAAATPGGGMVPAGYAAQMGGMAASPSVEYGGNGYTVSQGQGQGDAGQGFGQNGAGQGRPTGELLLL